MGSIPNSNSTLIGLVAQQGASASNAPAGTYYQSKLQTSDTAYNTAQANATAAGATPTAAAAAGAAAGAAALTTPPTTPPTPATPEAKTATTATPATTPSSSATSGTSSGYQFVDSGTASYVLNSIMTSSGTPNFLNQYQNVAYHFRFFCVNDIDLYATAGSPPTSAAFFNAIVPDPNQPIGVKSSNAGKVSSVIVAESGSTIYNIQSVEFTSMIGPNLDTRNINIGTFSVTILEPMGGSFLTALKAASDACSNSNFKNCFYYLELSFKAYDTLGNQVTSIFPTTYPGTTNVPLVMQQGDRWIWEVQISDIDITIDAGGGTYGLTLVLSDGMALDDEIHAVPSSISVSGATLDDYFTGLGKALSDSWFKRYGNYDVKYGDPTKSIPAFNFFPIQLGPNAAAYPGITNGMNPKTFVIIDPTSPNTQPQQTKDTEIENGYVRGVMQPGVTIEQLIESALCATKQGQTLGLGGQNPLTTAPTSTTSPVESFVFRVIPTVIIGAYNVISSRYQVTVTFNIVPYYTQYPITTAAQTFNQTSQTAVQNLVNRGLLQKKYEYIFTGLNSEVLNLNIQLNAKWNVQLPRFYGQLSNTGSFAPAKTIAPNGRPVQTQKSAAAALSKQSTLYQQIATQVQSIDNIETQLDALNVSVTQTGDLAVVGFTAAVNASNAASNAASDSALLTNLQTANTGQIANVNQTITAYNAQNPNNLIPLLSTNATSLANESANISSVQLAAGTTSNALQTSKSLINPAQTNEYNIPAGSVSYAENLILTQSGTPVIYQTTFSQGYKDSYDQTGTDYGNDGDNGKVLLGSVLNQLYDYAASPLMQIDLTIRGDPYWLGETNLAKCVYFRGAGTPTPAGSYQSPQMFGETNFVLDFKIPYQVSSNPSNMYQPQLISDEAYHGVYIVTQIKNTFEGGQFTQILSGKRQPLISLLQAQGLTTNAVSDGSGDTGASSPQVTTPAAPTTNSTTATATLPLPPPLPPAAPTTSTPATDDGTT